MFRSFREIVYRFRARLSLGQQIALLTGVLCIVLVSVAGWLAGNTARDQSIARTEFSMSSLAGSVSDRLDMFLLDRYRDIRDVARFEPLMPMWRGSPDGIRSILNQMQESFPAYTWLGFARPDGTVVAATGGLLEGQSVAERPWFIDGLNGPVIKDVHDAKLLAGLLGPQPDGEPLRFVDVAVPVRTSTGQLLGILGAHLSWQWAHNIKQLVLSRSDPRLQTDIWILNSDGEALLGPATGEKPFDQQTVDAVMRDGRTTFIDSTSGGDVLTAAYRNLSGAPPARPQWIVVTRRPLAIAYAEANEIAGRIGLIGLILGALGIAVAALAGRHVASPIRKLAARMDLIGRDPSVTSVRREHGSKEIVTLSSSIRSLLRRVAHAEGAEVEARKTASAAEQRMEERTRTLGEHIRTLQTLADTDPLTQLLNRRAFLVFATDAMNYFKRHGRPIAILVIDIDFFKRVNDTYGHAVGDTVIEAVSRSIGADIRTTDKAGRFGGEEFVVLLRETEANGATVQAERIRQTIASTLIEADGHDVHVTVSIGLAMAHSADRDIEDVIERADRALYRAKESGRNVVVADIDALPLTDAAQ